MQLLLVFLSFPLFCFSRYTHATPLQLSHSSWLSCSLFIYLFFSPSLPPPTFFFSFPVYFSSLVVSLEICSSSDVLFSAAYSLLSPSKKFFIYVAVVSISRIYFSTFLGFPFFCFHCTLFTYYIPQYINHTCFSNIYLIIPTSLPCVSLLLMLVLCLETFFSLGMSCNFSQCTR